MIKRSAITVHGTADCYLWSIPLSILMIQCYGHNVTYIPDVLPKLKADSPFYNTHGGVDHLLLNSHADEFSVFTRDQYLIQGEMQARSAFEAEFLRSFPRISWRWFLSCVHSNMSVYRNDISTRIHALTLVASRRIYGYTGSVVRHYLFEYVRSVDHACYYIREMDRAVDVADGIARGGLVLSANRANIQSALIVVPHGDMASSKRLYDAFRCGAIPLVVADACSYLEHLFKPEVCLMHVPQMQPGRIGRCVNLFTNHKQRAYQQNVFSVPPLYHIPVDLTIRAGEMAWASVWAVFYLQCVNKQAQRRTVIKFAPPATSLT